MKPPTLDPFSTGLFVGVVFALMLAWAVDAEVASALQDNWVEIFGILAALIAAVIALFGVQRQIRVQTAQADAERTSQLRASIAVLPMVLSSFYKISEKCIEISLEDAGVIRDPSRREEFLRTADVSGTHLDVLRDCIRYSDPISAGWLSLIARQYQLCTARFGSLIEGDHILLVSNQQSMAVDWAVLRAVAGHSFEFARGEVEIMPRHLEPTEVKLPISSAHFGKSLFNDTSRWLAQQRTRFGAGTANDYFG